jgi:biopolymer transport protein ExbD
MKVYLPAKKNVRIEMLPLIDIVFLLLVFFIYAMLSMAVHRGLTVVLPTSETARVDRQEILTITVKGDGSVYIDKQFTDLEHLSSALKTRVAQEKDTGVLLFADRKLPYQQLFMVLDRIRQAGLTRISLQAQVEQDDQ